MSRRTGNTRRPYIPYHLDKPRKFRPQKLKEAQAINRSKTISFLSDMITHNTTTNPPLDQTIGVPTTTKLGSNSFAGVTNPRWKEQVRNVQDATTTASGERFDYSQPFLTAEVRWYDSFNRRDFFSEWWGHPTLPTSGGSTPGASVISETDDRAKRKFLEKLDSILSSVELGQDLGEYRETLHGITNPLKGLRDVTLNYLSWLTKAKRSFRNVAHLEKALADAYLEWTFGWKPLALDIKDAIVGLQNRSRQFDIVPIHAGSKNVFSGFTQRNINGVDPGGGLQSIDDMRIQCSYTVRYKGVVRTRLDGKGRIPVNEVLQIDLPHFIPTAWDLLPYSFVVDYFTNVGDIIRAFSARTNQIAWVCKTTRTEIRRDTSHVLKIIVTPTQFIRIISGRPDGQNSVVTDTSFTRSSVDPAVTSFLPSSFHFSLPVSEKPWENIAALLTSRIRAIVPLFRR